LKDLLLLPPKQYSYKMHFFWPGTGGRGASAALCLPRAQRAPGYAGEHAAPYSYCQPLEPEHNITGRAYQGAALLNLLR